MPPASYAVRIFTGTIRPLPGTGRSTGMFKLPLAAPIDLGPTGFAGDEQADRQVHGGPDKAVHLYPSEHFAALARRFPGAAPLLLPGSIGENLSATGLGESEACLGDVFALGGARLQICQPRSPCWKIDSRYGTEGMAAYIAETGLSGWYWRVLEGGRVAPGDTLDLLAREPGSPTLAAAAKLWRAHRPPIDELGRLAAIPGIAAAWRDKIVARQDWLRQQAGRP